MKFKKFLAIGSTLLLVAGLTSLGAMSAQAHTPTVSATCSTLSVNLKDYNNDGINTVSVTIDGIVVDSDSDFGKSFKKDYTFSDKTVAHTWQVDYTAWDDPNGTSGWSGSASGTTTPCVSHDNPKVPFCHATPADTAANGWNMPPAADPGLVVSSGHATEHDADIIPAFTYWVKDHNGNWSQQSYGGKNLTTVWSGFTGAQILAAGCQFPPLTETAAAGVSVTAPACGVAGVVSYSIEHATWQGDAVLVTTGQHAGQYKRTAVADPTFAFPGGDTTKTVYYTPAPALDANEAPCVLAPDTPGVVQSAFTCNTDGTGSSSQATVTLSASDHYYWTMAKDGGSSSTVSGTVDVTPGSYVFTAHANSGYSIAAGSSVFPVTINAPTTTPCLTEVTPVKPDVTSNDVCGTANDSLTVDSSMPGVLYTVSWNQGHTVATVTASVSDASMYVFKANVQTSWNFEFTNEPCPVVSVDVAPSATDQECVPSQPEAEFTTLSAPAGYTYEDGGITVALDANLEYTITGTGSTVYGPTVVTSAFTALDPGTYDVTVRALNGYVLGEGQSSWSLTVDEGLCAVTFGDPYAVDQVCSETGISAGYIWVDFSGNLANELDYHIVGPGTDSLATQEINNLPPGAYTVTAIAKSGFVLDSSEQSAWPLTIGTSGDCQLISHPPVTPIASMSNLKCTGGGSYTLAATEGVLWFVNGSKTPTEPGTYPVGTASTVNVVAQLVNDVDYTWEEGAQTEWTFDFTLPVDCIPTLAFTGASGGEMGLLLSGGLLLFGGTIIALERRFRSKTR